jgi:hypothetical protein
MRRRTKDPTRKKRPRHWRGGCDRGALSPENEAARL